MRIGIITFWESKDNYGQILQSFALQRYLRNQGYDAFVIRYLKPYIPLPRESKLTKVLRIYPLINFFLKKLKNRGRKISDGELQRTFDFRNFDKFRADNIKYSENIYDSVESLRVHSPKADCYITGSDQVWHWSFLSPKGEPYFLRFGDSKVKRIAYAPSFGVNYVPEERMPILKDNLDGFNAFSVREFSGKNICKKLGFDVKLVIDPTFLLSYEDYKNFISNVPYSDYAYFYVLNIFSVEDVGWKKIKKFLGDNGLRTVVTNGTGGTPAREWFEGVTYSYSTIPEWISNINHSKYFFTTSFHGVVFAIIMHSEFLYIPIGAKGANTRVESLLEILDLKGRLWNKLDSLELVFSRPISWESVDSKLSSLRKESQTWLLDSIGDGKTL